MGHAHRRRGGLTAGLAVGSAGGVIGGLLGGGNGVVFVAGLGRWGQLVRARRHGTATMPNIVVSAVGAAVYALAGGALDLHTGAGLILGGVVGGLIGARLLMRVPNGLLQILLIAVLVATAAKFSLDALGLHPLSGGGVLSPSLRASFGFVLPVTVLAGVVIGAWAGALGLGGGLLAVPTLVVLFGLDVHTAAGTSLLMFVPNSLAGALLHLRQGTAAPRLGGLLGLGAIPGALAGAALGLTLANTVVGLAFATFALIMAARETRILARSLRHATPTTLSVSRRS